MGGKKANKPEVAPEAAPKPQKYNLICLSLSGKNGKLICKYVGKTRMLTVIMAKDLEPNAVKSLIENGSIEEYKK